MSSAAHQRPSVVSNAADNSPGRGKDQNHHIAVLASADKLEVPAATKDSLSLWERVIVRKKQGVGNV